MELNGLPNWQINAYLVDDGDVTLVDTGLPWTMGALQRHLDAAGYAVSDVDRVLLTHFDFDHIGGLLRLQSDLDAPIYAHEMTADLFTGNYRPSLRHPKGLVHQILSYVIPPIPVEPLADGEDVGGFTAHHTPGHNPDHLIYVHDRLDAGFLGDLVRSEKGRLRKPVFWDNYSLYQVEQSIRDVAADVPSFSLGCPGHGTPLIDGGMDDLQRLSQQLSTV